MDHAAPLITTVVAALGLAFILALIATRLRIPAIAGYLLAGVILGPFTPGFIADVNLAQQLAEIGVILLMFGVGLHFSLRELMEVRAIAVPGAVVQIAAATAMGWGVARWFGWDDVAGIVFGLALSVASTVVLLRALQDRHMLETERGHIAVGWLIVEDLATVLALGLLPTLPQLVNGESDPSGSSVGVTLLLTLGRVAAFSALMLVVGRRLIPMLLHFVAFLGNRELFRLAVLAIALGTAYGAALLFDVSFALGAFFAGMVLAESELSQQAAQETLPLRDAFAVLFFVSVGMLFNPSVLVDDPIGVVAVLAIVVLGKSLAAFVIVVAFRYPIATALTISVSLAQIGEFSFILAALGVELGLLPQRGHDLLLAGSILSIMLNPLLFAILDRMKESPALPSITPDTQLPPPEEEAAAPKRDGFAIVVGYGRVGRTVVEGLQEHGMPFVIIEEGEELAAEARALGFHVIVGNAVNRGVIRQAGLSRARWLLVGIPHAFEAARVVIHARAERADLHIIARAHSDAEAEHLRTLGASRVIMAEREVAIAMLDDVLAGPGPSAPVPRAHG